jgi:hypothetical protein
MQALLCRVLRDRIQLLESELFIFDEELSVIWMAPGHPEKLERQLICQRNVKATLHDVLFFYFRMLSDHKIEDRNIFSFHSSVLRDSRFLVLVHELFGQQSSLNNLVGPDYYRCSHDENIPDDVQLRMIQLVFPYEFEFQLLQNERLFKCLLNLVKDYRIELHEQCLRGLYQIICEIPPTSPIFFFTADSPLFFTLTEHLLVAFVRPQMLHVNWNSLEHFAICEKCSLIASQNVREFLGQNAPLLDLLEAKYQALLAQPPEETEMFLRKTEGSLGTKQLTLSLPDELLPLRHVILELKRMAFQVSPSAVLCVLANASSWLTDALSREGHAVGAEEIFQFLVFALSCAGINFLPSLVTFITRFVDSGLLQTTKFGYVLTQFQCCCTAIQRRLLPVKPFFIFPFSNIPGQLQDKMTIGESLVMRGFAVWAFPTFVPQYDALFPAMLAYTGNENDVAICNEFRITSNFGALVASLPTFETVPTKRGTFLHLTPETIESYQMIAVDVGNFDDRIEDIRTFSAMMKMIQIGGHRMLSNIVNHYQFLSTQLHFVGSDFSANMRVFVSRLQQALRLQTRYPLAIDGIMRAETVTAIEESVNLSPGSLFAPEILNGIIVRSFAN